MLGLKDLSSLTSLKQDENFFPFDNNGESKVSCNWKVCFIRLMSFNGMQPGESFSSSSGLWKHLKTIVERKKFHAKKWKTFAKTTTTKFCSFRLKIKIYDKVKGNNVVVGHEAWFLMTTLDRAWKLSYLSHLHRKHLHVALLSGAIKIMRKLWIILFAPFFSCDIAQHA